MEEFMSITGDIDTQFPIILELVNKIKTDHSVDAKRKLESLRRLYKMKRTFDHIQPLNHDLLSLGFSPYIDVENNEIVFPSIGGEEPSRIKLGIPADSLSVKPLSSGYIATNPDWFSDPKLNQKLDMEIYVDSFYYNAHRLLKQIGGIRSVKRVDLKIGAAIVRNHLMEHDRAGQEKEAGIIYNFGASEDGPIVKPMRFASEEWEHTDKGLYVNFKELLEHIGKKVT